MSDRLAQAQRDLTIASANSRRNGEAAEKHFASLLAASQEVEGLRAGFMRAAALVRYLGGSTTVTTTREEDEIIKLAPELNMTTPFAANHLLAARSATPEERTK